MRIHLVLLYSLLMCFFLLLPQGYTQMVPKDSCLKCHGPYDKLVSAKPSYTTESKEIINPHVYDPHDKRDSKNIPDCTNCHQPHAMDTKSAEMKSVSKPDVKWCYSCHHTNNFVRYQSLTEAGSEMVLLFLPSFG